MSFTLKTIVILSAAVGALAAQEIPVTLLPEWGKLGISAMCLGILAYLILRTGPEMFRSILECQQSLTKTFTDALDRNSNALERMGSVHKDTSEKICERIDNQTGVIRETLALLISKKEEKGRDSR